MHQLQNDKLPKLFYDLLCTIDTVHGHNIRHASKNIYFRTKLKNALLKICSPLEVLNFGQTLTMFFKTKNCAPLPSKNSTKKFSLANTKSTSATKLFNFSTYLQLDMYSLPFQLKLLFASLEY